MENEVMERMLEAAEAVPTAPWYVWLGLSLLAAVSFWCQATVTEERLVPALNVVADYYNIPDDIAGATLMAAGASSPELFSSIVALFITHSALGLGTIVGSEIFNQLIICAGAVYASKTGKLQLDRAIVTREVGFYALAIVLLYVALQDVEQVDGVGELHIFISFWEACMVFSGYLLYVACCANMEAVVAFCSKYFSRGGGNGDRFGGLKDAGAGPSYGTSGTQLRLVDIEEPDDMPFYSKKKNLSSEPEQNWKAMDFYVDAPPPSAEAQRESFASQGSTSKVRNSFIEAKEMFTRKSSSIRESLARSGIGGKVVALVKHSERPSGVRSLHDVEANDYDNELRCFLWQKSRFYDKAYFGSHAWHLRWFTFANNRITSVPDRQDPDEHQMIYPRFTELYADEKRLIIKLVNPDPKKRDFTLMAPSRGIFDTVVEKLESYMLYVASSRPDAGSFEDNTLAVEAAENADVHLTLIEFPSDGSFFEIIVFLALFPLRLVMHFTLPDVRKMDSHGNAQTTIGYAFLSTFMCLVWLIIGSYAMVASLENLAELMDIPDAVIGVTVSAAGTSLPNYIASKVAAEKGFGNQAVSNAFGSNTFNIMVGLGLPWLLYTSFGTGFQPYHALPAEGILESIIILAVVLLIFVVLMLQTGFVILKWHGNLFIVLYVLYIAYAIGEVYLGK